MLPLQWVGLGLVLVVLDVAVDGWDALPDPLGWAMVLRGVMVLRAELGPGVLLAAVAALVVAVAELVPWLLEVSAPVGWALSLPQVLFVALCALALAPLLLHRQRSLRAVAVVAAVVAVAPALVLAAPVPVAVIGLVAFVAVAMLVWFVYLLLVSAPELGAQVRADP